MKKVLLLLVALAAFSLSTAVWAEGGKKDETELGERMEDMRNAFRKLRKQISDATKVEENLKLIADLKKASLEASKLSPAKAAEVPEKDRAAFVADFQKDMVAFVAEVEKLEAAVKGGHLDVAAKLIEELGARSKEGHKEFKKADDKH